MSGSERYERRVEPSRSDILFRERCAIESRLRGVCAHLPEEEFQALVARIAEIEIKYRLRKMTFGAREP